LKQKYLQNTAKKIKNNLTDTESIKNGRNNQKDANPIKKMYILHIIVGFVTKLICTKY